MSRRQTLGKWLSTSDAALSWGERIVKWLVIGLSSGTITGLAGTVIGLLTDYLVYGLVAGVLLGMLLLGGFSLKAISIAAQGTPPGLAPSGKAENREAKQTSEAEIRRLKKRSESLQEEVAELTAERDDLLEWLQAQSESLESQPGDEALQRECFQV